MRLTRWAADARGGSAAERVERFRERLAAVAGRRRDAADLAAAEGRRMLAERNEAAAASGRELSPGTTKPAVLSEHARVHDGHLTYPAPGTSP